MGSVKNELHLGGEFISAGFVLVTMITMLIVNHRYGAHRYHGGELISVLVTMITMLIVNH